MADLWLRADYPLGPFPHQPVEQAICDVLAKAPYAAWTTGECAFRWDYVDRPAPGTSFLALLQPPGRPVPPDGLRYYYPEANDRRTVSQHVVHAPNSVANPTAASPVDVLLECFTTACGHLPPMSPTQPIPSGSPDLRLTRFRKCWRIVNGSQPSLWFFWWGDDDSGGLGPGHVAPNAPPGWESTPVRTYPLPQLGNVPSAPLYPFPSPARMPPGQAANGPTNGRNQAAQQADGAMMPPATPLARQQQLAALASQAGVAIQGGTTSTLEARQQQYQALAHQQQQQAAALAAAAAAASGGNPNPAGAMLPPGLTPQQISAAQARQAQQYMLAQQQQQRQQQQQQQQQQLQQQQQRAAAATAAAQTLGTSTSSSSRGGNNSRRKSTASSAAHGAQSSAAAQQAAAAAAAAAEEAAARPGDILDHLTHRQREMHRYALQHQLLAPVFDPWSTSEILAGEPRVGRAKAAAAAAANGVPTPPPASASSLLPGLGRRSGPLSQLAITAARIPIAVAEGKEEDLAEVVGTPVEARRAKLEEMLRKIEDETKKQDEWYRKQLAGLAAPAPSCLGSEVSTPAVAAGKNTSAAK
ncbi:hypothetical protein C6P46_000765 [Rhodotorula mucilaginosa]|uniref:Uncharacterized protein n=1 Tax=Rhodotorula mucilaginosa TaxID=5537 RepID=A0A9P6VW99_RHOMI|nr:hypothetical protein C6P46_000765 [Rhodotorula mucilaginosa]TKA51366.1 hypothetical protein B0A53_05297 [Rhodotorula sp. CCFEE 5036]